MRSRFVRRPRSGGWWEWYEGCNTASECLDESPELVLLCHGGTEVVEDSEWSEATGRVAEHDGFVGNYWEITETTQAYMPGMWRKASGRAVRKHIAALSLPPLGEVEGHA